MKPEVTGIYQDPTENNEEFKEYSSEENYYALENLPDAVTEYVTELERKIKAAINSLDHLQLGCDAVGFTETSKAIHEIKSKLKS